MVAEYESPHGEEFTVTAFMDLEAGRDGEDLDGNRGWDVIEIADSGYEVEPEPTRDLDKSITDYIGDDLQAELAKTPVENL